MHGPLGVAIVGCGVIGPVHAAALSLDAHAELRWAIDPRPEAAARLNAQRQASSIDAALADPDVALVVICTPHHLHAAQAMAALTAGKHVLCEKPMATTPEDVAAMVACAAQHPGQVAAVCFQHRFNPVVRRLAEVVRGGDLGPVTGIEVDFACTRDAGYYASGPWRGRWSTEGGGTLINQAIHTIDLACWLGGLPLAVQAEVHRRRLAAPVEVEDHAQLAVGFAGGHRAIMRIANDGTTPWRTLITVRTTQADVTLGDGYRLVSCTLANRSLAAELRALSEASSQVAYIPGVDPAGKLDYGDVHRLAMADTLAAIRAGRPARVGFADGAVAIQVVLGAYTSAARGCAIDLPASPFARPDLT